MRAAWIEHLKADRPERVNSMWHGLDHWERVANNGAVLCRAEPAADPEVVWWFAYSHDVMRENEYDDPEHGPRAAQYLKQHRHLIDLNDEQHLILRRACAGHTVANVPPKCKTLAVCWDADRLDLGRVGITPDPAYLFTDHGKFIANATGA